MSGRHAKIAVASIIALAGVAATVAALIPARSERTDAPKPRIVTADGSAPPQETRRLDPPREAMAWEEGAGSRPPVYAPTRTAAQLAETVRTLAAAVNTEQGTGAGAGEAVAGFLMPGFTDDRRMADTIASLGGVDHPRNAILEALLGTALEGASIDTANITVEKPDAEPEASRGINMNRNRSRNTDAEGNQADVELVTLTSSFQDQFPDAVGENARGELVEVTVPMRSASAEGEATDLRLSLVLRRTPNGWQPAWMEVVTPNTELMDDLMVALRAAAESVRRAEGAGGTPGGSG
ncbi:MAG: hypothetical protein ACTS22_03675 [Phycisphaerales bacterium]